MRLLSRCASFAVLASSLALGACNAITGAEELVIDGDGGGSGEGGNSSSSNGNGAGTTGPGGTPFPGTTTTTSEPVIQMVDAPGVGITQIALYQGVKAILMEGGGPGPNTVPIVAGRDAFMRLFLNVDGNYDGQPITARLHIEGNPTPFEYVGPPPSGPTDANINTTLNFDIPGASLPAGAGFRVEILQPDAGKGPNPGARYPAEGFAPTYAANVGQTLKIVLVPVRYGADGSNRLPDTSDKMVQGYRDLFYAMYPVPQVDLTVRAAVTYNGDVNANGYGWDQLLGALGQLRADDNVGSDVYYYGIFEPASSLNSYCGGGCVLGLGNIGSPGDPYSRAAIGLGFSDDGGATAWETAVHEIGHTHGRYHAPCGGPSGVDGQYPYSGAKTGVWGFNLLTKKLYSPSNHTDVMGYCFPIWVSDYTYKAFFNRIKAVNGASLYVPPELKNRTYDRVRIDMDGNLHWMPSFKMEMPPQSTPIELTVTTDAGPQVVTGHFYEYDHLPGGVILWPQAGGPSSMVALDLNGVKMSLSK
jgi:hypothetical protein